MQYRIFDPTGNITALVEDQVNVELQPQVAAKIMELQPEVEQVGFVSAPDCANADVKLRMAGGEFCGNATMSTAALYALNNNCKGHIEVVVQASGATNPLSVVLDKTGSRSFDAGVHMPPALAITTRMFEHDGHSDQLGIVIFEGISHVIVDSSSTLFYLQHTPIAAQEAVRTWCARLKTNGLGLMFINAEHDASNPELTPLVYVPGSNTVYWENSCASGSAAVGMYVAHTQGIPCELCLHEPGGVLRVCSDPSSNDTWLYGNVVKRS